jgi:hypothetical protein
MVYVRTTSPLAAPIAAANPGSVAFMQRTSARLLSHAIASSEMGSVITIVGLLSIDPHCNSMGDDRRGQQNTGAEMCENTPSISVGRRHVAGAPPRKVL